MNNNSKKGFFYRVFCGLFIGISIIAPGISGSVMAMMMGIYDELINIIANPFKNLKKNILYCIPLAIGAGISVVVFINLLKLLFEKFPTPAYLLFIGLIAGSIPTIWQEAVEGGFKKRYIIGIVASFVFAVAIGLLAKSNFTFMADTAIASKSIQIAYFSLCGVIAGMTSMVPGMSVSMILMMLNVYEPLLSAASELTKLTNISDNLIIVIPVCICFAVGMILFSNLIKIVFKKFRGLAYFMVIGFMLGSIISILPSLPVDLLNWILSAAAIIIGVGISILFEKLGQRFNANEEHKTSA